MSLARPDLAAIAPHTTEGHLPSVQGQMVLEACERGRQRARNPRTPWQRGACCTGRREEQEGGALDCLGSCVNIRQGAP